LGASRHTENRRWINQFIKILELASLNESLKHATSYSVS